MVFTISDSSERLQEKLNDLGIEASVVGEAYTVDSRVLAISLARGTRVKQITSQKEEIALAIQTASFSFLIPIEGTSYLGISIPISMKLRDYLKEPDSYLIDAGRLILTKGSAAIGVIQRKFKIGFNRAASIMDQLEDLGVVGPERGTSPREIKMTLEQFEEIVKDMEGL